MCFKLFGNALVNLFLVTITYEKIVILPRTVQVTFITMNIKTSKTEGKVGRHIAKRISPSLEGNYSLGLSECYFIMTLQTCIIHT